MNRLCFIMDLYAVTDLSILKSHPLAQIEADA